MKKVVDSLKHVNNNLMMKEIKMIKNKYSELSDYEISKLVAQLIIAHHNLEEIDIDLLYDTGEYVVSGYVEDKHELFAMNTVESINTNILRAMIEVILMMEDLEQDEL